MGPSLHLSMNFRRAISVLLPDGSQSTSLSLPVSGSIFS